MKSLQRSLLLTTLLLFGCAIQHNSMAQAEPPATMPTTKPATMKRWISPDHFDAKALLDDPPAKDSAEHQAEVAKLLELQANRTPAEIARCKSEEKISVFSFAIVLGDDFNARNLPQTAAFMKELIGQSSVVTDGAKAAFNRTRPYLENPAIVPCVELEKTKSYPSGHATRAMIYATILAEIYPDKKDDLLTRGRQIGTDRNLAGMHWPSDVTAGQKLGVAIAEQMLKDDDFKVELAKVKDECLAVHH